MTQLPREKKLFWDWCCHVDPGPLTEAERKLYAPAFDAMIESAKFGGWLGLK
jgi:hypothetical protein